MENETERGDFEGSAQARTATRDIFGGLDDHLPEIRVPAEVKVDAQRAAAALGLDVSGWMRELVYGSLYGPEHIAKLYEQRIERVLGNAKRDAAVEPGDAAALPRYLRSAAK